MREEEEDEEEEEEEEEDEEEDEEEEGSANGSQSSPVRQSIFRWNITHEKFALGLPDSWTLSWNISTLTRCNRMISPA